MRIPFPERIPLHYTVAFCVAISVLQMLNGTSPHFILCSFLFIFLGVIAFNALGGLSRPSGGFVFALVFQLSFGFLYKIVVGEPGQSNLHAPERTMEVYVGIVLAMVGVAYVTRILRRRKGILPQFQSYEDMHRAALVSLGIGIIGWVYPIFGHSEAIIAFFRWFNAFLGLAVILGVTYQIHKSDGRRSINMPVIVASGLVFISGLLGFSKEGLLIPFVTWLLAAGANRYKVGLLQIAVIGTYVFVFIYYLSPYCQYGRAFRNPANSLSDNAKISILLLTNLDLVRQANIETVSNITDALALPYYNTPQGFADRLQMISTDDALISLTDRSGNFGIAPILYTFENLIPHFIWHDKPLINYNTMYGQEIGLVNEGDETTGISFSPASDAYYEAGWVGVFVLFPWLLLALFVVTDSLNGDTRASPFSMLAMLVLLHPAAEGGLLQFAGAIEETVLVYITAWGFVLFLPLISELFVRKRAAPGNLMSTGSPTFES